MNKMNLEETKKETWFGGISGLRFLAALAVVVSHIELLKWENAYPNLFKNNASIAELGSAAVLFFFVLSGFLITYLLIKEKEKKQTVSIRKFYLRRIFRIWPIYLICVLFVFLFVFKVKLFDVLALSTKYDLNGTYWKQFLLYLCFVPNLAFSLYGPFPHIGQSWSIGVEEQFYFIWPIIFKKLTITFKLLLTFIVILILSKFSYFIFFSSLPQTHQPVYDTIKSFIVMSKIESMIIGGLFAFLWINKSKYLKIIYHPIIEIASYVFSILIIVFYNSLGHFQNGIYIIQSFLFAIIVINVATNNTNLFKFNWPVFETLGEYSYSLYMVHMFIIMIVIGIFRYYTIEISNHFFPQLLLYTCCIGLSLIVCFVLNRLIEKPIAILKHKYGSV